MFTSAGRFDRRVEGQQVGLLGDPANGDEDRVDVFAVLGQGLHHVHGLADFHGQHANRIGGVAHDLHALAGRLIGVAGGLRGLGRVARHVLRGGGHFLHGGGDLIDLGHLLLNADIGPDRDVRGVLRGVADALYRRHHLSDHPLQFGEEGIEAFGD